MIGDYVREIMDRQAIPGLSVGVAIGGRRAFLAGYGMANLEHGVAASSRTVYEVASLTKTFTAALVLLLAHEGKLKLDGPITEYVEGLPGAWKDVTPRHILTHVSGLPSYTAEERFWEETRREWSPQEIIALVSEQGLLYKPGTDHHYDNTGYILLGLAVEKITGREFAEVLVERILDPLDMTDTMMNDLCAVVPNRAAGYVAGEEALENRDYHAPSRVWSAGALLSTVADLVKWEAALHGHGHLPSEVTELLCTPVKLPAKAVKNGAQHGVSHGWFLPQVEGHPAMGHSGGILGFSSIMLRFLEEDITVAVLFNSTNVERPDLIAKNIAGHFRKTLKAA
ncbi:MAG: serine hydrolase domain-containing protein [Alphaproteobacteria bacterium]